MCWKLTFSSSGFYLAMNGKQWHQMEAAEVLRHLGSNAEQGLSGIEAARRLEEQGANELRREHQVSAWAVFLEQFKNIFIVILLVGVVLSACLGQVVEAAAIAVIVLFAAVLGFYQEYRAERALEALRDLAAPTAAVLRDGQERSVPAREVVPGDIIHLRTGDKIPADGRLFESFNLKIDEGTLTGESIPVEKQAAALESGNVPVADRNNMAFAGTAVTYGRGHAVVVATGMKTEFGQIAQYLQTVPASRTPLQENLDRVGKVLARAALAIVVVIAAVGLLRGEAPLNMIIFGIALAVAVVPEALPAVVTISLAIGAQRMARRNALVRRLSAVETLGSVSVICSDKTGTLTKDEMTVRKIFVAGKLFTVSGTGYEPVGAFARNGASVKPEGPIADLLRAAALASDASLVRVEPDAKDGTAGRPAWQITGDPTEGALVVAAAKAGLDKAALETCFPRINEIPFTSERKRMTTLHATPEGPVAYAKGAPEIILRSCGRTLQEDGVVELETTGRAAIVGAARNMAEEALRILAVAYKPMIGKEDPETNMIFLGLLGMIDPPRPEAKTAIATCAQAGIKPIMITGDHPSTAAAVARELGLLAQGSVTTGAQLDAMSDLELDREVEQLTVFARVSPAHKLRIVAALQRTGHFVAMTGDGINDAPALKKANMGIAMGITGTDVTREAADMTLMDDNFASIVAAVEEGRSVFENIKKYLVFLLSSNLGEILLLAAASLSGWPLPLSAVQILYVNLATDGLPALALAVDPREEDLMRRLPRDPRRGVFTRPVLALMIAGGLWSALVNLSLFRWALVSGRGLPHAMTLVFGALVVIEFFKAYNYRSDKRSVFFRPFANRWLNRAVAWELMLVVLIIDLPFFQAAFGTVKLSLTDWLILTVIALTIFPVLEGAKWLERRGWFGGMARV
jgi:Ca2+-transporting ATPase